MMPLSLRFAVRELRSGIGGFRIFLACLALGVAAIAAASSTAEAFRRGLAVEARDILGGDVIVSSDRAFSGQQARVLQHTGKVAYSAAMRSMAEAPSGQRRMVELRGVDRAYPLAGKVDLADAAGRPLPLAEAFRPEGRIPGAAVEQTLLERLDLKLGQTFTVGDKPFVARAVLVGEPDRLTRGFALGPRVLIRLEAFRAAGFFQAPGFNGQGARLLIAGGASPPQTVRALKRQMPEAGLSMRDRTRAAVGIDRLIGQLEYFLGFVGLASLVAGGLGVAGAVSAFLEGKTPAIAALKALGATGGLVRNLYLIHIALLSALGIGIGVIVGAGAPFLLGWLAKDSLPIPALFDLYPQALARAAMFGALAAAAFSLGPLARARATRPSALFRREIGGPMAFSPELLLALAAGGGLAALAVWTAPTRLAAAVMIGSVIFAFALLWVLGRLAIIAGGRARGMASGPLRIGLANLAGPRSAARAVTPAVGLGVALLAAVVLIQSSLLREVKITAPKTAPALVFTEVPGARAAQFDAVISAAIGPLTADRYQRWPFFTGRIIGAKGRPIVRSGLPRDQRWAFDRDMPMAAVADEPSDGEITAGRWWPRTYKGPPLIALDADVAGAAGLKVGDSITLSLLGREVQARIAALRKVSFGGFGPAFTVSVDPHTLEGAELSNIAIAKASRAQEDQVMRALAKDFAGVNVISVREQLEAATGMFDRLALAIRGAASVAALAGLLVLVGAIAAGARARAREAAVLKVLGASRLQILTAYVVEYGLVGLIAAAAGVGLGYAAAWPVVVKVFRLGWAVDWGGVAALVGGAALIAGAGGLIAAFAALAQRPAPALRAE